MASLPFFFTFFVFNYAHAINARMRSKNGGGRFKSLNYGQTKLEIESKRRVFGILICNINCVTLTDYSPKPMLLSSIISLILFSGTAQSQTLDNGPKYSEARVIFRWDKAIYEDSYFGNSEAADKLLSLLEEIGEENIDSVSVIAYASPEGVYEHNLMLSRRRAREFDLAVKDRIGLKGKNLRITVLPGGEAWEQLRDRVAADSTMSDAARSITLKVLDDDSISNETRKWRMSHNALGATPQEGDIYHYLLLNHYPHLRCLAIKIYVKEAAEEANLNASEDTDNRLVTSNLQNQVTEVAPAEEIADSTTVIAAPIPVIPGTDRESLLPAIPDAAWTPGRTGLPVIGLSTNLIYDATWIPHYGFTSVPSFSLEYYPARGHWTFGADVDWSHWLHPAEHRYNQIHNITLWGRRYFKNGEEGFRGTYLLAGLNGTQYGLGWDEKGWEGELAGISAGIGHKWNWGRFFLDTGIDLGFFYSVYDPYVWGNDATQWYYYDYSGDPDKFVTRRKGLTWFGPTRAYISIGFDLFKRKK